jgi:hypothetical protein
MARDVHGRATSSGSLPKRAIADAATLRDSKTTKPRRWPRPSKMLTFSLRCSPSKQLPPETQTAYRIGVQICDLIGKIDSFEVQKGDVEIDETPFSAVAVGNRVI